MSLLSAGSGDNETDYLFYHPEIDYGSEAVFNPFSLMINGSYDMFRNGGHNKDVFDEVYYNNGVKWVLKDLANPIEIIEQYGWKKFLAGEILPTSFNIDDARSLPNYFTHTMGNGMQYVKAAEWLQHRNVRHPYLLSAIMTTIYQFMNEAVENASCEFYRVDPIADIYVFNPLGFIVFSTKFGRRLYSEILPMYDWSLQPVLNLRNNYLENAGQQYVIRRKLPYSKHYSAFLYWGIHGMLGLSYNYRQEHNFSVGGGIVANKLNERRRNEISYLSAELDGTVGLFYDKNNSLMTSVILTGPRTYSALINIYPGFFRRGWFNPGMYLSFVEGSQFIVGFSVSASPLGIAGSNH